MNDFYTCAFCGSELDEANLEEFEDISVTDEEAVVARCICCPECGHTYHRLEKFKFSSIENLIRR